MIRSICIHISDNTRCGKVTRAHRHHKFCRKHTLEVTGVRRAIPHQLRKAKVVRIKPVKIEAKPKGKKKS